MSSIQDVLEPKDNELDRIRSYLLMTTPRSDWEVVGARGRQGIEYSSTQVLADMAPGVFGGKSVWGDLVRKELNPSYLGRRLWDVVNPLDSAVSRERKRIEDENLSFTPTLLENLSWDSDARQKLTKEQWEKSDYFKEGIKYTPDMTVGKAKGLANIFNRRRMNDQIASYNLGAGKAALGLLLQIGGAAVFSPEIYLTGTLGAGARVGAVGAKALHARNTAATFLRAGRLLDRGSIASKTAQAAVANGIFEAAFSAAWIPRDAMIGRDTSLSEWLFEIGVASAGGGAFGLAGAHFSAKAGRALKNQKAILRSAVGSVAGRQYADGLPINVMGLIGDQKDASGLVLNLARGEAMDIGVLNHIRDKADLTPKQYTELPDIIRRVISGEAEDDVVSNLVERYLSISPDAERAMRAITQKENGLEYEKKFLKAFKDQTVNDFKMKAVERLEKELPVDLKKMNSLSKSLEDVKGKIKEAVSVRGLLRRDNEARVGLATLRAEERELKEVLFAKGLSYRQKERSIRELLDDIEVDKKGFHVDNSEPISSYQVAAGKEGEAKSYAPEAELERSRVELDRMVRSGDITQKELDKVNKEAELEASDFENLADHMESYVSCLTGRLAG